MNAVTLDGGGSLPQKSERSLKTGYLVSAFKDSDDMTGKKFQTTIYPDMVEIIAGVVEGFLRDGYETVMVEARRS